MNVVARASVAGVVEDSSTVAKTCHRCNLKTRCKQKATMEVKISERVSLECPFVYFSTNFVRGELSSVTLLTDVFGCALHSIESRTEWSLKLFVRLKCKATK